MDSYTYMNNEIYTNNTTSTEYMEITGNPIFYSFVLFSFSLSFYHMIRYMRHQSCNEYTINTNQLSEILIINRKEIEVKEKIFTSEDTTEECPICLDNYEVDEKLSQLVCNHYFHKKCIDEWFTKNRSCPLCRLYL